MTDSIRSLGDITRTHAAERPDHLALVYQDRPFVPKILYCLWSRSRCMA